jgi:hypothetical protein
MFLKFPILALYQTQNSKENEKIKQNLCITIVNFLFEHGIFFLKIGGGIVSESSVWRTGQCKLYFGRNQIHVMADCECYLL